MMDFRILFHPKNKGAVTFSCLQNMPLYYYYNIIEYFEIQDDLSEEWDIVMKDEQNKRK